MLRRKDGHVLRRKDGRELRRKDGHVLRRKDGRELRRDDGNVLSWFEQVRWMGFDGQSGVLEIIKLPVDRDESNHRYLGMLPYFNFWTIYITVIFCLHLNSYVRFFEKSDCQCCKLCVCVLLIVIFALYVTM